MGGAKARRTRSGERRARIASRARDETVFCIGAPAAVGDGVTRFTTYARVVGAKHRHPARLIRRGMRLKSGDLSYNQG